MGSAVAASAALAEGAAGLSRLPWIVSADAGRERQLEYAPVPANGPVRAIEERPRLLPALPVSGTAIAATGGFLAGAAVLGSLRALRRRTRLRRGRSRRDGARTIVASRSFLVDVHLLGR